MSRKVSRRGFVISLGSLAAASALPTIPLESASEPPLYPPADLSYFDNPITPSASEIRFGYAAITWGGNDLQAIKDVSEVGFRGIQLRSPILKVFGDKPNTLAELLNKHQLECFCLSGGGPAGNIYNEADEIATQVKHATFTRHAGGLYLQMTDSARPRDRKPDPKDFKALGRLLTAIGNRTTDLGISMAYHNHMRTLGEAPDEVDALMDASDPRYVKLLLDVAHYAQGGGDPARAIRKYRDRILFLHIKDVESTQTPGEDDKGSFRFVDLGRGRVDLPGVFSALREIRFRGWAVVELDSVPDKTRTPKESAMISKKYLEEKLGMKI